jgi:hypothetical protein
VADAPRYRAFTARIDARQYDALRAVAFFRGWSLSEAVAVAIRDLLAKYGDPAQLERAVEEARQRLRSAVDDLDDLP